MTDPTTLDPITGLPEDEAKLAVDLWIGAAFGGVSDEPWALADQLTPDAPMHLLDTIRSASFAQLGRWAPDAADWSAGVIEAVASMLRDDIDEPAWIGEVGF